MAQDIKSAGVLAEVLRYGVPWHGRIEGGVLHTGKLDALGNEVARAWPQPTYPDCWLIQKPGLIDPYLDDAEGKASDALSGHELTTWAVLQRPGIVHGKTFGGGFGGWVWFDPAGLAWSVTASVHAGTPIPGTDNYRFDAEIVLRFAFKRFGELRADSEAAADAYTYDVTLAAGALGQSAPTLTAAEEGGRFVMVDVLPDGAAVIFAVYADAPDYYTQRALGFCEFTVSTSESGTPEVAFDLIAGRAQTLGTLVYSGTNRQALTPVSCVLSGTDPDTYYSAGGFQSVIESDITYTYADRLIGYHYGADGVKVPATLGLVSHFLRDRLVDETFSDSGATWGYTWTESQTTAHAYSITVGSQSITANAAYSLSITGGGDETACTRSTSTTLEATGLTTVTTSGNDTECPGRTDPSNCAYGYDQTNPPTQPAAGDAASMLYNLPYYSVLGIYMVAANPVAPLHEMFVRRMDATEASSVGAVGVDVRSTAVHAAGAGYYNRNPAPPASLTYTPTAVSFT